MRIKLLIFIVFPFLSVFSQKTVEGSVSDEDGVALPSVMIMNISSQKKVYTASDGTFSIEAAPEDELRFIRSGYERSSIQAKYLADRKSTIKLTRIAEQIEEVEIANLTGDIKKDSRKVAKIDKGKIVEEAVGLPQPTGKMRETPADIKQVLLPILLGNLNIQGLYDLISGDARRMKRQYKYDDLQEDISWIRDRVEDDYFIKEGIPKERIPEFIEFSFSDKPQTRTFVRAKNLTGALSRMEESFPVFVKRLKENTIKK